MAQPNLEEIEGEEALAWVRARNARCLETLQGVPCYEQMRQEALAILEARDRIPFPAFRRRKGAEILTNFWQDAQNVRGLWRRTTLESYRQPEPEWETILDLDALAAEEGRNWVMRGANYLPPEDRRCLLSLSDGGKDAVVLREFDLEAKAFVEGGFDLPEAKCAALWLDADRLLVSHDFGPESLTESGYARCVRLLRRGQSLEQAEPIFEGERTDMLIQPYALRDAEGALKAILIHRAITIYDSETYLWTPGEAPRKLPLPLKSSIQALLEGRLILSTNEDWTAPSGQRFETGDLFAWSFDDWLADPATPAELVLRPGPREMGVRVSATRDALILTRFEEVRGAVEVWRPKSGGGWSRARLPLPENVSTDVVSASDLSDRLLVQVAGYLTPPSLWLADAATGEAESLKAAPARFDASGLIVEQLEAPSKDGTLIPYFVIRRAEAPMDGSNPTLLYGYGGFEIPLAPAYSATIGKLWLERGGIHVVANIRGGGEFGPKWHQCAIKENRHRTHEDFQAVAEDLIRRKITSPKKLGIMGGSQGGLLMGVTLTQRPDLINAAVIQVPLFDMLRYHKLLAGPSWIGEYGDPEIPAERAWLESYSPYQHLRAGQPYPEVFIHTSTKDDRVHPGHARRAAAKLEELGYPTLFYENTDGGHGAAANLRETARRLALEYSYLARRLMS
ncbi:prolyl oligopeptidase family serine peptidase [Neomegalonema perideroedes]|uniref:prolyl oligopeptidase family serine peptidase n=1 Tax=Neomegalonema perideroedes TaxID=217219 RepID=UPI0003777E89|nr:prolyl oligopeptidase family serine peptidase [Neomegalonema perideroedes]